jgi:hypothetical protein
MRRPSWFALFSLGLILCLIGWAGYQGWSYLSGRDNALVPPLLPGHQEVAWFSPATSGDGWERLVAALKNLEKDWAAIHPTLPPLKVSFEDAFLNETASVPQIALYFAGHEDAKLWLRWYKLSGDIQQRQWLEKLRKRGRPPLAIIGGDSSDQALTTARELKKMCMDGVGKDFEKFIAKKGLKKGADELGKALREFRQDAIALGNMQQAVKQLDDFAAQLAVMGEGDRFKTLDMEAWDKTTEEFDRAAGDLVSLARRRPG